MVSTIVFVSGKLFGNLIFHDQRKVKFPFELDVTDLVTDELKAKLLPLNRQLKLVEKARDERRKIRSKSKAGQVGDSNPPSSEPTPMAVDEATGEAPAPVVDEGVGPEGPYREKELAELEALVDPALKEDLGSSPHGLYELCGK